MDTPWVPWGFQPVPAIADELGWEIFTPQCWELSPRHPWASSPWDVDGVTGHHVWCWGGPGAARIGSDLPSPFQPTPGHQAEEGAGEPAAL